MKKNYRKLILLRILFSLWGSNFFHGSKEHNKCNRFAVWCWGNWKVIPALITSVSSGFTSTRVPVSQKWKVDDFIAISSWNFQLVRCLNWVNVYAIADGKTNLRDHRHSVCKIKRFYIHSLKQFSVFAGILIFYELKTIEITSLILPIHQSNLGSI